MKTDCNRLKSVISELCKGKGVNQTKAFVDSGVGKNFFSNLSVANPSMEKLSLLADYFGVSVDYLLGKETSSDEQTIYQISEFENDIIRAYRTSPDYVKQAVLDLLKIREKEAVVS